MRSAVICCTAHNLDKKIEQKLSGVPLQLESKYVKNMDIYQHCKYESVLGER